MSAFPTIMLALKKMQNLYVVLFYCYCVLTGQWSCSTCLVSNPADKKECLACGTPPPTSSTKEPPKATAPTSNWGDLLPNTTGMSAGSCEFTLTVLRLVFYYEVAEKV